MYDQCRNIVSDKLRINANGNPGVELRASVCGCQKGLRGSAECRADQRLGAVGQLDCAVGLCPITACCCFSDAEFGKRIGADFCFCVLGLERGDGYSFHPNGYQRHAGGERGLLSLLRAGLQRDLLGQ